MKSDEGRPDLTSVNPAHEGKSPAGIFRSLGFRVTALVLFVVLLSGLALIHYPGQVLRRSLEASQEQRLGLRADRAVREIQVVFRDVRAGRTAKTAAKAEVLRRLAGPPRMGPLGSSGNRGNGNRGSAHGPPGNQRRDGNFLFVMDARQPGWLLPGTRYPDDYELSAIKRRFRDNFVGIPVGVDLSAYIKTYGDSPEKQFAFVRAYMTADREAPGEIHAVSPIASSGPDAGGVTLSPRDKINALGGKRNVLYMAVARNGFMKELAAGSTAAFRFVEYRDDRPRTEPGPRWVVIAAAPREPALLLLENLRRHGYYIVLVALLVGGAILFPVLQWALKGPVIRFREGLRTVEKGDLSVRISRGGGSEFDALVPAFNDMTVSVGHARDEMHRLNATYKRFMPAPFLELLGNRRIQDVQPGDHAQRDMTVLRGDIRGFTALTERMLPREVFEFMNAFAGIVGPAASEHGGFIHGYNGDAFTALFPRGPEGALRAVKTLRRRLRDFNRAGDTPIEIGMGIHTGSFMLGTLALTSQDQPGRTTEPAGLMQAVLISDAMHLVARVESLAGIMGVATACSEGTLYSVENPDEFRHRFLGTVPVRITKERVSVFEIFDGDEPRSLELKQSTRQEFENGIERFYAREFGAAAELFAGVLRINPDDHAAELYLQRSRENE